MIKKLILPDDKKVLEYRRLTGFNELQSSMLINRNIEASDALSMMDQCAKDFLDPRGIMNAFDAAKRITEHIKNGSKIVNYSDGNDVDGAMSAVVFHKMMNKLGSSNHEIYVNDREEGFGMNVNGIKNILVKWPETKLIISSDNGIVAYDAVNYAQSQGIEVIVTDHHEPSSNDVLPNCLCVNPHIKEDTYEFKELCGTAVLWKVMTIAYQMNNISPEDAYEVLDIVATATIADVVPLIGENRIIVKEGLININNDCRKHWRYLRNTLCTYSANRILMTAKDIGWNIGPSFNAPSRMIGKILPAIELFLTEDEDKIKEIAKLLKDFNDERKALTKDQLNGAIVLANKMDNDSAIIVFHEEMSLGLVGLVAGRLKDRYYKPTICFTKDEDGNLRGSGRSIEGIDIKEVLDKIQEKKNFLVAYGGHALACGLTIEEKDLEEFIILFNEICEKYPPETFIKNIYIDTVKRDGEIDDNLMDSIEYLEPFGASFSEPTILVSDIDIQKVEIFGKLDQHLKIICKGFDILSWNAVEPLTDELEKIKTSKKISAFGTLSRDNRLTLTIEPTDMKYH